MTKKQLYIVLLIIIFIIVACIIIFVSKKKSNEQNSLNVVEDMEVTSVEVTDEMTGETKFQIIDKNTNEVIADNVEEAEIQMYQDNLYYNPTPNPIDEVPPKEMSLEE